MGTKLYICTHMGTSYWKEYLATGLVRGLLGSSWC